ncbi:hypothetical protein KCP71_24560 [Salmonella enterica subsp. enterica]|nr:hypothetical protein KCP71_24560 [Salmonella enterica subsp. enterica]
MTASMIDITTPLSFAGRTTMKVRDFCDKITRPALLFAAACFGLSRRA